MLWQHLAYVPFLIFGSIISVQDWKRKSVNVIYLFLFLISCLLAHCFFKNICFIPFLIFVSLGILLFLAKKSIAFGAADYFTVFSTSFLLNEEHWPQFIICCGTIGCILGIIKKEKQIPFIPAILMSATVCLFFI